ncbi:hypothetical protein Acsp06_10090 [Actinomycetospora sp. NBRC 106375]|uniref:hypothetical protein n=1 Tax=Actinomycetospora sp. NBRC 106375 TaxID=3032207 RepID=UPI0024A5B9EC|nr:hypothetical protein [Actinomycetospora sp. NBRC 106375]GLZ44824.1 hypothetical protein Acsp06_10090 [Actinomycetospora sp. NBRC 106375]
MSTERDLLSALLDDPPEAPTGFSEWLRDQDLGDLAAVARTARLSGDSFGRHLRSHAGRW